MRAGVALALLGVFALAAVSSRTGRTTVLLGSHLAPNNGGGAGNAAPADSGFEDSTEMMTVKEPTEATFASMRPASAKFLARVGIKAGKDKDTDLNEACGVFKTPCVASVGACLDKHAVEGVDGEVTVDKSVCNCFAKSLVADVTVPGHPDVALQCDYTCLESIDGVFNQWLAKKNGRAGARAFCKNTFSNMADKQFGTDNDVVASEADLDSLTVVALADPKVVRAGAVLQEYINNRRERMCPLMKSIDSAPRVTYARVGMEDLARSAYHIEAVFDDEEEFVAHISHLPHKAQLANPGNAKEDPHNYLGRFTVVSVSPDPCATGKSSVLVNTAAKVKSINSQKLGWKATHRAQHHGKTAADFGMGLKRPPLSTLKSKRVKLSTSGFVPPKEFRCSDQRAGEEQCRAYDVLDQGSCGSCYAFAAATAFSARMCSKTQEKWNIVASPQEMMDCSNGCQGGWPLSIYEAIADEKSAKVVEKFCDEYTQKKDTCGGYCDNGNTYSGVQGTAVIVGDDSDEGIKQIQLELMKRGPGTMAVEIYSDFISYTSGVYVTSADAKKQGGHAVTLIGWGEEGGVPYWLVQNSWGANSGDKGFWKIRRGTNEADIETWGLTVVQPEVPSSCPNLECKNKGSMLKDCSCACNGGWAGKACDKCELACQNGGVVADDCSKCICPAGFSGLDCHGRLSVSPLADCAGSHNEITVEWKFGGDAPAPTQQSFIALYANEAEENAFSMAHAVYMCGSKYDKTNNAGLCPNTGKLTFKNTMPGNAGTYKIAVVQYQPPNEFGQDGYATVLKDGDTVAVITAIKSDQCDSAAITAAIMANSPVTALSAKLAEIKAQEATDQAAQDARLEVAEPMLEKLHDAPTGSAVTDQAAEIILSGTNADDPVLWASAAASEICYTLPSSQNINPKAIVLYAGDGSSGSYFPTGIQRAGFEDPLPAESQGCIQTTFSPGLTDGLYTIKLQKQWTPIFATKTFYLANANVDFSGYAYTDRQLSLWISWSVTRTKATPTDVVKVYNSEGAVIYWLYTSCACQDEPAQTASYAGEVQISLLRSGTHPGGYDIGFFPAGGEFEAANAPDWIDWKAIGW